MTVRFAAALALAIPATFTFADDASATTVGQPLFVVDGPSGSILDFFDFGQPSGVKDISLSGTITRSFGWSGVVGQQFEWFGTYFAGPARLTIAGETYTDGGFPFMVEGPDAGRVDPVSYGVVPAIVGDIDINVRVEPAAFTDTDLGGGQFLFESGGVFESFPDVVSDFPPVFDLVISVFLDSPLPTRIFEETDAFGNVVNTFSFVEGPLDINRIEVGLVGGTQVLVAPIPLPAGLPLMALALAGLGVAARRKAS